jgi:hypothetical protein
MKSLTYLFLFVGLVALSSCDRAVSSGHLSVTGKVGEVLVVSDNDVWESDLKECLDSNLTQWIMPYFPDVATFELIHKTPNHFAQGVKRYRNILFLKIDSDHKGEKGAIVKRKDVWARGQVVVDIIAKDYDQLVETCKYGLDEVHDIYDEMSWKRIIKHFKTTKNKVTRQQIKDNFGIDLALPSNSQIVTKRSNFYRVEFPPASRPIEFAGTGTQDVGSIFSGLMIYQYDFVDSVQFEFKKLLQARDTMLKHNVPHEIEGLYMGTQYQRIVYPEGNITWNSKKNIKGYEMRGMFKFTGKPIHSTGGAFWAFHFIHPKRKKLMCLSGYVDAPATTSWTHALREIQAVLRSVEYVE